MLNKLKKDHFPKYGIPSKIITDHGTQFSNIVERIYRELSKFFRSLIGENQGSWWSWINIIESWMNETYHETTQFTPIELHLNKKPKRAWENWLNFRQNSSKISYERKLKMAKDNISRKGKIRASKFDEAHRLTTLKEGDYVLVKAINELDPKHKILKKFLQIYEGPYEIIKEVRAGTYILWNPESKEERGMFHTQDLKIYKKREVNSEDNEETVLNNVG